MQIEISGLKKEYGSFLALDDVSLTIPAGAVLALAGPNGAGKSTLMKIVAGLLEATSGTVKVGDLDVLHHPRKVHERLGFLPDFFGLYDELTVRQFLLYFARAYGLGPGERETRVASLVEKCRLSHKVDAEIKALSRGLKQRVGIARTLINNPPVLLLDEPAAGLDPEARHELQMLFQDLGAEGKTLIVSSHILSELEDYCTHVAMLQKGRLVSSGDVASLGNATKTVKKLSLRLLSGAELAENVLRRSAGCTEIRRQDAQLDFQFSGDDAAQAALLEEVLAAKARVLHFAEESGRIQDTYLALMKGTTE